MKAKHVVTGMVILFVCATALFSFAYAQSGALDKIKPSLSAQAQHALNPNDELRRLEIWIGFWKFVLSTVVVGIFGTIINYQIQRKKLELDKQQREQEYLGKFIEQALDDNLEKRIRFAHYFASLTVSEGLRQKWNTYHADLRAEYETKKQVLLAKRSEWQKERPSLQVSDTEKMQRLSEISHEIKHLEADLSRKIAEEDIKGYTLVGVKYNKRRLNYIFLNGSPTHKSIVRRALDEWASVCDLDFLEVEGEPADLHFSWVTGDHGDGHPFDDRQMAHAFFPPPFGGAHAGRIHFNDDIKWVDDPADEGISLYIVALSIATRL
jgi:hypothetical protein